MNSVSLGALDSFEDLLRKKIPGFDIRFKNESRLMRVLGTLLFFIPGWMNMTTTIGHVVYFPNRADYGGKPNRSFIVLCHELVHVMDGGVYFSLTYLLPQVLALLALTAFINPWVGLPFLLFLAPWPAPMRLFWEARGYAMTMAVTHWLGQTKLGANGAPTTLPAIVNVLTSSAYYFMSWSKDAATEALLKCFKESLLVRYSTTSRPDPYRMVYEFLQSRGLLAGAEEDDAG